MIVVDMQALVAAAKNRPRGYVDDVLCAADKITDDYVTLSVENYDNLCKKYRNDYVSIYDRIAPKLKIEDAATALNKSAPGHVLLRFLRQLGFNVRPDCPCRNKIELINARGLDWVKINQPQVVSWLSEEATKWGAQADTEFLNNLVARVVAFAARHEQLQFQQVTAVTNG